jgi:hypothetical protein
MVTDDLITPVADDEVDDVVIGAESMRRIRALNITSCDFCPDGCVDLDCYRCYSPLNPDGLRRLAANLATAAALCQAWQLGRIAGWIPGGGQAAP